MTTAARPRTGEVPLADGSEKRGGCAPQIQRKRKEARIVHLMTDEIRVLIIDSEQAFREKLAADIADQPGFRVAGCATSVTEGLELLREEPADIVLLEAAKGAGVADTFVPRARAQGFQGAVVMLTSNLTAAEGAAFVRQGVSAISIKSKDIAPVLEVMQLAVKGVTTIEERFFRAATECKAAEVPNLSEREWQIVHHLVNGLGNRQIAARIHMSVGTVKASLRRIYAATGVRNRNALVLSLGRKTTK